MEMIKRNSVFVALPAPILTPGCGPAESDLLTCHSQAWLTACSGTSKPVHFFGAKQKQKGREVLERIGADLKKLSDLICLKNSYADALSCNA